MSRKGEFLFVKTGDYMKIAAAYVRVSTEDQTELSPTSQIKQIREYAKNHGYIVPDEFVFADEGISGKNTQKRPAFNRMIGLAKTKPKPFECILLWKYSRFARNREDSIVYKSMLRKQLGIDVISISESLGDDKMSILIEALIEAMDEYYSINLAEEVKRGMTERVSRGEAVSVPAYGYDIEEGKYIINEAEAEVVRQIFSDFNNGVGTVTIARNLNAIGIKTKRGKLWENRTVKYILHNPVYIGKIRWNPEEITGLNYDHEKIMLVDGVHEPLLTKELWDSVQEKLSLMKRTRKPREKSNPTPDYMLYGLIRCGSCGGTLTQSRDGLQCHKYAHGTCNTSHYISLSKANAAVIDLIQHTLENGIFTLTPKKQDVSAQQVAMIDKQIQNEKNKLLRVKEAFEYGVDTLEEYKENKNKILQKISELESSKPVQQTNIDKKKFAQKYLGVINTLKDDTVSEADKNHILRQFVEKIVLHRPSNEIEIFYHY